MNPRLLPVGTFLLGVVLTVAAYETVRLVTNARNALAVASSQMADDDDEDLSDAPDATDRRRRTVTRPGPSAVRQPARNAPPVRRSAPASAKRTPAERQAALEERLAEMTELEREEFLERRRLRRERRRPAGQPQPRPVTPIEAGSRPVHMRSAPVDEAELVDTAEP